VASVGQYNCRHNDSFVLYARTSRKLGCKRLGVRLLDLPASYDANLGIDKIKNKRIYYPEYAKVTGGADRASLPRCMSRLTPVEHGHRSHLIDSNANHDKNYCVSRCNTARPPQRVAALDHVDECRHHGHSCRGAPILRCPHRRRDFIGFRRLETSLIRHSIRAYGMLTTGAAVAQLRMQPMWVSNGNFDHDYPNLCPPTLGIS